jgi:hypothetical protein
MVAYSPTPQRRCPGCRRAFTDAALIVAAAFHEARGAVPGRAVGCPACHFAAPTWCFRPTGGPVPVGTLP